MALIVQKYGGTSMGTPERILNVARRVKRWHDHGHKVVVVVSAMSGETNRLLSLAKAITSTPNPRELDQMVSTGEQVTISMLAMALNSIGVEARSYTGRQVGIKTDSAFTKARIESIDTDVMTNDLDAGRVIVVAGFQGFDAEGNITTLGRGGSDTSGVALAAALKADECQIYTDVDGVYTCDPRIVPQAQKLPRVTYEEMLEMAALGAKVLHPRSVELAMAWAVPLQVLSSFDAGIGSDLAGTHVVREEDIVEKHIVNGVTYARNEAKITLVAVPDKPGIAASIFAPLGDAGVNVDMIVQNISSDGKTTDMTFTVPRGDVALTQSVLDKMPDLHAGDIRVDAHVSKISVIGIGMSSHTGVAKTMFQTLADRSINIQAITTSEIKISVLISEDYTELAVRALHTAFGLDKESV